MLVTLGFLALLVGALVALAIRRSRRRDAALRALANEPVSPPIVSWQITGFSSGYPVRRRERSVSQPTARAAPAASAHADDSGTSMALMDTSSIWSGTDSSDCGGSGSDSGGDSGCGGAD